MKKRLSRKLAMDAMCKQCIYSPQAGTGTWKEQVARCTSVGCALWPHRPGPSSGPWAGHPIDPETVTAEWLRRASRPEYDPPPLPESSG